MWLRIKEILRQNEYKIIISAGFILVAVLSFEAGIMREQTIKQNSVVVNSSSAQNVCGVSADVPPEASKLASSASNSASGDNAPKENCAYLGSKNSNKYHLPTCQYAKRIKPENVTCFKDENEAKLKGYLPDKGCIK